MTDTNEPGIFLGHVACVNCVSSNAMGLYQQSDGKITGWCFSCQTYAPASDLPEHNEDYLTREKDNMAKFAKDDNILEEIAEYDSRGIIERKIKKIYAEMYGMKVSYSEDSGGIVTGKLRHVVFLPC